MNFLENPSEGPAPFSKASYIVSFEEVEILSLYEIDGIPYFAIVQQPEEVVIVNLSTKSVATLACNDNELYPHQVSRNLTLNSPQLDKAHYSSPTT